MERNSLFAKERANFAYHKINRYYQAKAYEQALAEIEANRELTASSLNVGNQLKLNKIYTDCIVHMMLDAFEVDGDLSAFANLMQKNHTNLELHASRNNFQLFTDFYSQKDSHPNYKSRTTYYNQKVTPDESQFEDTVHEPTKKSSLSLEDRDEIQKDFLDSIEKPSFYYAPLDDDEPTDSQVIKSNVDRKAIHDDFFDAIAPPSAASPPRIPGASNFHEKNPFAQEAEKKAAKDDSSAEISSRKKTKKKESTSADKHNPPEQDTDYIKEKKEMIQDGKKITQTTHKSGGRVTEFTLGGPDPIEELAPVKAPAAKKPNAYKEEVEARQRQKVKKAAAQKATAPSQRTDDQVDRIPDKNSNKKTATKPNFLPLLAVLLLVVFIYGGFKLFSTGGSDDPNRLPPVANQEDNGADANESAGNGESPGGDAAEEPELEEPGPDYILPTHEVEITAADLEGMGREQLRYAINEMFARHGWNFGNGGDLYDYFSEKDWYEPDTSMTSSAQAEQKFSAVERANLRLLINKINSL